MFVGNTSTKFTCCKSAPSSIHIWAFIGIYVLLAYYQSCGSKIKLFLFFSFFQELFKKQAKNTKVDFYKYYMPIIIEMNINATIITSFFLFFDFNSCI